MQVLFFHFRRMKEMETSPFLPLPEGMGIGQIEITATQLTVEVISTQPCASCPECGCLHRYVVGVASLGGVLALHILLRK
jgi:hypothetical protein